MLVKANNSKRPPPRLVREPSTARLCPTLDLPYGLGALQKKTGFHIFDITLLQDFQLVQLVQSSSKVIIGAADIYQDDIQPEKAGLKDVGIPQSHSKRLCSIAESLLRYTSVLK